MKVTFQTVLSSLCCFQSSARLSEGVGLAGSDGRQLAPHGSHKKDEFKVDPTLEDAHRSALLTSRSPSSQKSDEQTATLNAPNPGVPKQDGLQVTGQAPKGVNGYFNNAHDLVFYQPVMNSINETEEKVLQWLTKFTMSGAEFDASGHVPGCHPGTRITILEVLQHWVNDLKHGCRIVWLYGPAGVGKSAILQSLAESLSEASRLGATLFFSRPNGRYNPTFVLPTIAYQLAVRIPSYKEYVKQIMINDPKLLEKDMEHQFQALIIEPFTRSGLTTERRWVILLDGLDECQGENAQVLIVRLISRFTRQYPMAPLVWVIASRPEAHLQVVFNSEEVKGTFTENEVLANSDEACRDVEKFLRAKFGEVRQNYKDLIPMDVPWPAEQDIARVSTTSSGLFALAATIVHYVDDPDACDPISQLATVLSVTKGLEPGSLSTLYTLYSTILAGVPKALSPILNRVLTFYTTFGRDSSTITDDDTGTDDFPLVLFATIFGLQQHTVYGALRKLHSVIKVPPLSESGRLGIKFYHASFPDYLQTLEIYAIDVDMMKKVWQAYFTILHGGDSTAYRDATSDGQPPVPLSWDVKLADSTLMGLWRNGIECLLHLLSPQCPYPSDSIQHLHLPLNAKELQDVLEKIDFSAMIFRREDMFSVLHDLLNLFKWLMSGAPPELIRSGVVKRISVRELNSACITKSKLSYEGEWVYREDGTFSLSSPRCFAPTISPQHPHQIWNSEALPIEELISKLDKLRSEEAMVDVLIIGRQPYRRCALLCTQPAPEVRGSFYYVPYCQ